AKRMKGRTYCRWFDEDSGSWARLPPHAACFTYHAKQATVRLGLKGRPPSTKIVHHRNLVPDRRTGVGVNGEGHLLGLRPPARLVLLTFLRFAVYCQVDDDPFLLCQGHVPRNGNPGVSIRVFLMPRRTLSAVDKESGVAARELTDP